MGKYINIGNAEFESVRKDEYVDKSMLIAYVNKVLGTQRKFLCVTRARRFGKPIAAKMLNAYYDESVNSHALFHDLNIAKDPSYEPHLNKYSVMRAVQRQSIESYWAATSTYEGLKDSVVELLAGNAVRVDVGRFVNDIHEINSRDAVLTLLIHLGYLSYDENRGVVRIPNYEVQQEFERTIRDEKEWGRVTKMLMDSERLLADTLAGNAKAVAAAIDDAHQDNTSVLQYNDENSLACVLSLAYVAARKDYTMIRELPTGKGFADIVLLPNRNVDKPAVVLELKFNHSADTAIAQIKEKRYAGMLLDHVGSVLLVGINYDKKTKKHECLIECLSNKSVLSSDGPVLSQDKNVLSLLKICPKLNSKQGSKAFAVLRVVGEGEISVADLMKRVGGTNRSRFKAQLIDPFVEALLIAPTIPDKPNSSKQRYYLPQKGIELLKQLTQ